MLIKIHVKVYKAKTKEGKEFNHYKAVQTDHTLIDLKFTRAVDVLPKTDCFIIANATDVNRDENRLYPCLWCKKIIDTRPLEVGNRIDKSVVEKFEALSEDEVKEVKDNADLPF